MTDNKHYIIPSMPFVIDTNDTPNNPHNLPNLLPFSYFYDEESSILKQTHCDTVDHYLKIAYEHGSLLGISMDEIGYGKNYLDDFWSFISHSIPEFKDKTFLEIGCGKGYLLKKIQDNCRSAKGVEPGRENKQIWDKLDLDVINGFFPSKDINEKFDVILSFCVLEHIADDWGFINHQIEHLNDDGHVIIAVPNCEHQMEKCDPSIFIHEHYAYHSMENLEYFLAQFRLRAINKAYSNYGGLIYICAQKTNDPLNPPKPSFDVEKFAHKLDNFYKFIANRVDELDKNDKTLGIYCAGRAIAALPVHGQYRFFDDDPHRYQKYFPPFDCPIENMGDLAKNPVDELWIFSYYFADIIHEKIKHHENCRHINIIKLDEMAQSVEKMV